MAKTYKDIYPDVYAFEALYEGYLRARKGKRYRPEVLRFTKCLEENLIHLQNELIWKMYKTGRYREFYVYEPKQRTIAALPFRDRVVQHSLVAAIEPLWERQFIFDSYACRIGKGTHAGVDRAQFFLCRQRHRSGLVYVLKCDINKYFASINHEVLKQLLRRRIACPDTLWLLDEIIDSTPDPGIPIGNLTSQLFANIYLHELDEFVKYTLKEPAYMRYMDDFIVVHHDKSYLQDLRLKIETFLDERLSLITNGKTQIFPVSATRGRSLDFLGYKIWPTHRRLRKDSVRRMRQKLKLFRKNKISREDLQRSLNAWLGHAGHADTYNLQNKLLKQA